MRALNVNDFMKKDYEEGTLTDNSETYWLLYVARRSLSCKLQAC